MMESKPKYQGKFEKIKKYLPFILLFILTVILMLFFRYNKKSIATLIEKGKKNLLSIYADNLRPLFTDTQFTEEELFNFALYQNLPIDRDKKKMLILSNENGVPIYQISSVPFKKETANYETFAQYMGMNSAEKSRTDSILNSYRKQIYHSVLIGDNNAYAVNPNIFNIQKALLADLVSSAQKIDFEKTRRLFPAQFTFSEGSLASIINAAKENPSTNYLLITPDTVAEAGLSFDKSKFDEHLLAYEEGKKYASEISKMDKWDWDFNNESPHPGPARKQSPILDFQLDSNFSKVRISSEVLSKTINDSVRLKLEEVARKLKSISVKVNVPKDIRKGKGSGHISFIPPIPDPGEIIRAVNPAEITSQALKMVSDLNLSKLIEESMKYDTAFQNAMKDSIKQEKFKQKMRELNQKLKKLNIRDTIDH